MRLIRWPSQEAQREWCITHAVPRVVVVDEGATAPRQLAREVVLTSPFDQDAFDSAIAALSAGEVSPAPGPHARHGASARAQAAPPTGGWSRPGRATA